jgi:hypothetical protein
MKTTIAVLIALASAPAAAQWPAQLNPYGTGNGQVVGTFRAPQPVQQPTTRSYSVFDSQNGLRFGTVDVQPGGSFTQWDSQDGYRWGYITK